MANSSFRDGEEITPVLIENLLASSTPSDIVQCVIGHLEHQIEQLKSEGSASVDACIVQDFVSKEPLLVANSSSNGAYRSTTGTLGPSQAQIKSATTHMYAGVLNRISVTSTVADEVAGVKKELSVSGILTEIDGMKSKVLHDVLHPQDLAAFYHNEGLMAWFQKLATSSFLQAATTIAIFFNAIFISIDLDVNGILPLHQKGAGFVVVEIALLTYFTLEWLIRLLAFRNKRHCIQDRWFIFDGVLVILNIVDVGLPSVLVWMNNGVDSVLRLIRLLKLGRVARLGRFLRKSPELTILIKGTIIACRSTISTMCLLVALVYFFAMIFRQLTDGPGNRIADEYFTSVPHCMITLLLGAALPDNQEFIESLGDESLWYGTLICIYFIIASLTIMNMLIGVLVEVVGVVSSVEREAIRITFVKEEICQGMKDIGFDVHEAMRFRKEDLESILLQPSSARVIRSVGVDPAALLDFSEYIFSGKFHVISQDGLSLQQFIEVILELGGASRATVRDIIDLRKAVLGHLQEVQDHIMSLLESQSLHAKRLFQLQPAKPHAKLSAPQKQMVNRNSGISL